MSHETHEKQETLADIAAEMRGLGKLDEKSTDKIPRSLMGLGLRKYATRIEAAAKRERAEIEADALSVGGVVEAARNKPSGDAAAMREALEMAKVAIEAAKKKMGVDNPMILEIIDAALAAPTRNCDKYATYDAAKCAWYKEPIATLFSRWLFAQANEKGDNNGSK